jgi:hypothetical protein
MGMSTGFTLFRSGGNTVLVGILTLFFVIFGGDLILRPQQYKDDLEQFDHVLSKQPGWAIRVLDAFLVAFGIGVFYLSLRSAR